MDKNEITLKEYIKEHFESVNARLDNLVEGQDVNIDKIHELEIGLTNNNNILGRLTETVVTHERRSTNLERKLDLHERAMRDKLEPIQKHVDKVQLVIGWSIKLILAPTIVGVIGWYTAKLLGK